MGGSCLLLSLQARQPGGHRRRQQVERKLRSTCLSTVCLSSSLPPLSRLGQSEATALGHETDVYRARFEGFGWNTIVIDGHNIEEVCKSFHTASVTSGKPTALIARTYKG